MASERDLELLDNYIGNRMTAQEKLEFEQKLAGDAALKGELEFQQKITEGIRQARATELKARLKKIPVSSIPPAETTMLVKMTWWAAAAGLIMAGFYLYFNAGNTRSKLHLESATTKVIPQSEPPAEAQAEPSAPQQEPVVSPTEQANPKKEGKKTDSQSDTESTEKTEPALDVFDPSQEMEIKPAEPSTKIDNNTRISAGSSIAVETESDNKKYNFHYQFKDGKLWLYGSFEKNLYEIMEFFTENNKRTIFLFYKNNYYLLSGENEKVNPLTPITDPVLLKKLKEYRKN